MAYKKPPYKFLDKGKWVFNETDSASPYFNWYRYNNPSYSVDNRILASIQDAPQTFVTNQNNNPAIISDGVSVAMTQSLPALDYYRETMPKQQNNSTLLQDIVSFVPSDIEGNERIAFSELPYEVQDYIAGGPGTISQQFVPSGRDITSEVTGMNYAPPLEWSEEAAMNYKSKPKGADLSSKAGAILGAIRTAAEMGADIYNSSRSNITLPQYTTYHTDRISDLSSLYGMNKAMPVSESLAQKPTNGEIATDMLSKTAKGAAAGTQIMPGWGTLIGAAVGAVAGGINTGVKYGRYNNELSSIRNHNNREQRLWNNAYMDAFGNVRKTNNMAMNRQRLFGIYGFGGTIEPSEIMGVTRFGEGGTHEQNPNGGIPIGIGENGQPNLVEEGEVRWDNFIFSKRVKPTDEVLRKYNTFMKGGYTSYADIANKILDLHKDRENNPYDRATLEVQMQRLADAQEWEKLAAEAAENGMEPEEYQQYLQYAQSQGQMAFGGNLYKKGGYTDDGKFVHEGTAHKYYKENNGGKGAKSTNAYDIDLYLDMYDAFQTGNGIGRLYRNGKRPQYTLQQYAEVTQRVKRALETDPDAVYYMNDVYNQMHKEDDNRQPEQTIGHVILSTGASPLYNKPRYYAASPTVKSQYGVPKYESGVPVVIAEYEQAESNTPTAFTDITSSVQNANEYYATTGTTPGIATNNTQTAVQPQATRSAAAPIIYPTGYSSTAYPRTDYVGDNWNPFKTARDDRDLVNAFTDDFNKRHGTKHSPQYISDKLRDGIVGPIHNEFMGYLRSMQTSPAAQTQPVVEATVETPVGETAVATTPTSAVEQAGNTTATSQPQNPANQMAFTPYDTMRLAPMFDNLRSVFQQNAPDYTYARQVASLYRPASSRPVGQYMRYTPIDQHYLDTMADQQRNTMYGLYRNNTGSAAAANYYATMANMMAGSQASQAYRNSVLQNNQNRNAVMSANNQLDAANESARMQTQNINMQNYANLMGQSYGIAEQERLAVEQAQEANRQRLAENIGRIGKELSDRYYVSKNPALMYGPWGVYYKYPYENK